MELRHLSVKDLREGGLPDDEASTTMDNLQAVLESSEALSDQEVCLTTFDNNEHPPPPHHPH